MSSRGRGRIMLYIHFNKNDKLADYVVYQLQAVRSLFKKVVFITNSQISPDDKKRLAGIYDKFIQRENIGFDFAAWRDGIKSVGWKELTQYDSVTMMNDTCFGPIYPMEPIYEKMEKFGADFWGMTKHQALSFGMPGTNDAIPEHLQSYFMVYGRQVVKSKAFQQFWDGVKDLTDMKKVIQRYETQLTSILAKAGLSYDTVFDDIRLIARNKSRYNISELCPSLLIDNKMPFIKIKAFAHTPYGKMIRQVKRNSDYPISLIINHIRATRLPTTNRVEVMAKETKHLIKRSLDIPYKIIKRAAKK